ncbi:MAG: hypothetical protein U5K37_03845 [Natrialbaceae archaeon]|nr:hypothetical protein [Natrialbaceae archaeon]
MPIGKLCDAYLSRNGEDMRRIHDAIEVPTFNRDTNEVTWQRVTHAIRHETEEQTFRVRTERGDRSK